MSGLGLIAAFGCCSCAPNYRDRGTGVSAFDSPYPDLQKTPSARARFLSSGKITSLVLLPGESLDNSGLNWLLAATRYMNLPGHEAKSVLVKFIAGGHGPTETYGLEVGSEVLIDIGGVEHDGFGGGSGAAKKGQKIKRAAHGQWIEAAKDGQYYVFADQPAPLIVLNPDSKIASIGPVQVKLKYPVVWLHGKKESLGELGTSGQTVMTLSDFMTLVRKRNVLLGWPPNSVVISPTVSERNEFSPVSPPH